MQPGDKVRVKYKDAVGNVVNYKGIITEQVGNAFRVDIGGVSIVFSKEDTIEELSDERKVKAVNQGSEERGPEKGRGRE